MASMILPLPLLLLFLAAATGTVSVSSYHHLHAKAPASPLTPKAALLRYWTRKVSNTMPKPSFLLSKASPLSALDAALYERLAAEGSLSTRLHAFCLAANLFCSPKPDDGRSRSSGQFTSYHNVNFSNYGGGVSGEIGSFKNYSTERNIVDDSFRRYSRSSRGHRDRFAFYAEDGNIVKENFTSYAEAATGGAGDFTSYDSFANVNDLRFTGYGTGAKGGRVQTFSAYNGNTNVGDGTFSAYGKRADHNPMSFTSYADRSNTAASTFTGYGEGAGSPNDTFSSYGSDENGPHNSFKAYSSYAKGPAVDGFATYRHRANGGGDRFQSYGKGTRGARTSFVDYGRAFNPGSSAFESYGGGGASNTTVAFVLYGAATNATFSDYNRSVGADAAVTFSRYENRTVSGVPGSRTGNRWVEPGRFFRESALRSGSVIPMPDIRDRMPNRSFLPGPIASRIPFGTARLAEAYAVFRVAAGSRLGRSMADTATECERPPSRGETKRCVASVEDMVVFATSVLGRDVVVRSTESTAGSNREVMVGKVRGINGGKVTESVSCHQSMYPYLVYYCHHVPRVRAYEAEILAVGTGEVINRGVAICHLDTSAWSAGHGAFVALGPGPGKIEVCHWIYEGDMTWSVADR